MIKASEAIASLAFFLFFSTLAAKSLLSMKYGFSSPELPKLIIVYGFPFLLAGIQEESK